MISTSHYFLPLPRVIQLILFGKTLLHNKKDAFKPRLKNHNHEFNRLLGESITIFKFICFRNNMIKIYLFVMYRQFFTII
jgi:hypothetical protein